jgi:hypothetical protein
MRTIDVAQQFLDSGLDHPSLRGRRPVAAKPTWTW